MTLLRITTASGSVYEVDLEKRLYRKVTTTDESRVPEFDWERYALLSTRVAALDEEFEPLTSPDEIAPGRQLWFWSADQWARTSEIFLVEEVKSK